jgi:hypothetical protein
MELTQPAPVFIQRQSATRETFCGTFCETKFDGRVTVSGRIIAASQRNNLLSRAKQETSMALKRIAAATLLFLITAECASLAQDGTPKTHSLSLDVDLVLVNASVTDSLRNRPMSGLNKNNFQVWEDKVEQKITHF